MAASIASSKLLNLRNPALQILLRRHLLLPSASISPIPAQSLNSLHPQIITPNSLYNSSSAINQNSHIPNLPLHFQLPIEAARGNGPSVPKDDGDCDFEDDEDEFDDEGDEIDIEDLSGLEFDDEDEYGDEDDDEIRRPTRK